MTTDPRKEPWMLGTGLAFGVAGVFAAAPVVASWLSPRSGSPVRVGPRLRLTPDPVVAQDPDAQEDLRTAILVRGLREALVTAVARGDAAHAGQARSEICAILNVLDEKIRKRHGLERFELSASLLNPDDPLLRLDFFLVEKGSRKKGRGTRAMQDLIRFADQLGWRTILSPEPISHRGTTSRARLVQFYKRFGFVENKGRHKDFSFTEGMWRAPVQRKEREGSPTRADRRKNKKEHDAIVALARKIVTEKYDNCPTRGACLWHALAVIEAAKRHGRRLVLQAGSASWRRVPEALDDGVSATHFSYVWEPDSPLTRAIIGRILAGDVQMLPELHVWAGDPVTQELVDISTRYWPAQCKALTGEDWPGPRPPDYLWTTARDLPDDAIYEPDMKATMLVGKLAMLEGWKP